MSSNNDGYCPPRKPSVYKQGYWYFPIVKDYFAPGLTEEETNAELRRLYATPKHTNIAFFDPIYLHHKTRGDCRHCRYSSNRGYECQTNEHSPLLYPHPPADEEETEKGLDVTSGTQ